MQGMKSGFRGVFCSVLLDEIFWFAKISQKKLNSQMCWACAKSDERRQSSSERCTQKVLRAMVEILFVRFCSNECGLQ
jgi:hypothetical protein